MVGLRTSFIAASFLLTWVPFVDFPGDSLLFLWAVRLLDTDWLLDRCREATELMLSLRAILLPLDFPTDNVLKELVDAFFFCDFCDDTLLSCLRDATESCREEEVKLDRRDFPIDLDPNEDVEYLELLVDVPLLCEKPLLVVPEETVFAELVDLVDFFDLPALVDLIDLVDLVGIDDFVDLVVLLVFEPDAKEVVLPLDVLLLALVLVQLIELVEVPVLPLDLVWCPVELPPDD